MNLYLCCTPLHILLAALESTKHRDSESTYIIINDSPDLDELAVALLRSSESKFIMLPGAAHLSATDSQISLRQKNIRDIRNIAASLTPERLFIFYDQSAEAQALLNFKFPAQPKVIWLEDGITTYFVAKPFPNPIRNLIRNKIRYDLSWRGSKWLGKHPAIQEIACFYPNLLREDIDINKSRALPRSIDKKHIESFSKIYGIAKYKNPTGVIVVPHPCSGPTPSQVNDFIEASIRFCTLYGIDPILKFHPRDTTHIPMLKSIPINVGIAEQKYPTELTLLVEHNVQAVIGYRTSTLHVISAISPQIATYYYEPPGDPTSAKWVRFYDLLSIPPLQ